MSNSKYEDAVERSKGAWDNWTDEDRKTELESIVMLNKESSNKVLDMMENPQEPNDAIRKLMSTKMNDSIEFLVSVLQREIKNEREECAKIADEYAKLDSTGWTPNGVATTVARLIRDRSK
jgi:hypothetical protein